MTASEPVNVIRETLLKAGAAIYPQALDPVMLEHIREFTAKEVETYTLTPEQRDARAAPVYPSNEQYQDIIWRGAEMLEELGFHDIRWHAGALIPKWFEEGRRGWHVDMWTWENTPTAWSEIPAQIGILFYLDDATPDTGALLLAPGSHRREVVGHYESWEHWEPRPDEICIPASAGDAILLDPRAMHGTTSNTTVKLRRCLTMWYMVGFSELPESVRATVMLSVSPEFQLLKDLCPDYAGDAKPFAHCKKPQFPITLARIDILRGGRSDRAIVGTAAQPDHEFLNGETYGWYFGVGAARAPARILELGVRFGYSMIAMTKGAQWAGVQPELIGVDLEADGVETNAIASDAITRETAIVPRLFKVDTKEPSLVGAAINGIGTYDLIHVDADHSPEGIAAELAIAETWIKPNGILLVDDVDVAHVAEAALALCRRIGVMAIWLPTLHGTFVIDWRKRSSYVY